LLGAGSLQASIIYNQSAGLGLSAGPNSIIQNFSSPSPSVSQQGVLAAANNTTTQFTGLTLEANTNLYYDPNGSAGCDVGKGQPGTPSLPVGLTSCVGNYTLAGSPVGSNQSYNGTAVPGTNPDMTIGFGSQVYAASFLFAAPSAGAGSSTFEVQLFNGATQVDTTQYFKATLGSPAYFVITEAQSFNFIDITQLTNSGTMGVGSQGEGNSGYMFNALLGDVQASTVAVPEPGTIGLLSLGLAGIGYFARRRKA
jgi:hypothetical protein